MRNGGKSVGGLKVIRDIKSEKGYWRQEGTWVKGKK